MKSIKYIIGVICLVVLVGTIISLNSFKSMKINVGEIGKEFTVAVEETDIRDFNILDSEDFFELLKPSEVKKLKEHMKENDLKLKPGKYKLNQIDKFEDLLKKLEFEN